MSTPAEGVSFSPREMEVLALAWQCMETEPKINMQKLAELTGYTPGSASVTLGKIKRKMKMHAAGLDSSDAAATPKKAAKPTKAVTPKAVTPKAKRGVGPFAEEPSAKKKKGGKKRVDSDDDDEEFRDVKVKNEEQNDLLQGADEYFKQPASMRYDDAA